MIIGHRKDGTGWNMIDDEDVRHPPSNVNPNGAWDVILVINRRDQEPSGAITEYRIARPAWIRIEEGLPANG